MNTWANWFPLFRAFGALLRTFPLLLAFAFSGAGVFITAYFAMMAVHQAFDWVAVVVVLAAIFVVAHAAYLVFAVRTITSSLDRTREPARLSIWGWIKATLLVLCLTAATILGACALAAVWVAASPAYGAFLLALAFLSWTPLLPAIAVEGPNVSTALAEIAAEIPHFVVSAVLTSIPFLGLSALIAHPLFSCTGECWGLFEGGIIAIPIACVVIFWAATTPALISATVYAACRGASEETADLRPDRLR